ncbi:MAG: hypothetical protein AAGG09_20680 [Pseudomonadota bacterium]
MAGQGKQRVGVSWIRATAVGLAAALAGMLGAGTGSAQASDPPQPGQVLTCVHPFEASHPVVTGFLAPWAHGVTVDTGRALVVELRAATVADDAVCRVAAVSGPMGEAFALPFVAQQGSQRASVAAWRAYSDADIAALSAPEPGRAEMHLALFVDGPGVLAIRDRSMQPLPGSLLGVEAESPSPDVARILEAVGATMRPPTASGTPAGRVAPLSAARDVEWLVVVGAEQSLYSEAYALSLSQAYVDELNAATRAALLHNRGLSLSKAAGRAIDRISAVTIEALEGAERIVPLGEDAVGQLLKKGAAIQAAWATTEERQRLLDALAGGSASP